MMYKAAKEHMKKTNADFVITGEVLFQRPMSQNNRALHIIEKETGMECKVLRPLSAKHLPPTDAEKMGLINRENMGDIKGRSRKGQLMLAKHFAISEPPNAAGGCLLTDPSFSKRVKDILDHCDDIPTLNDIELLKVGRHFRITHDAKFVVGRNKDENDVIKALVADGDVVIEVRDYVGPTCILRCKNHDDSLVAKCAAIAARYSDAPRHDLSKVSISINGDKSQIIVTPADIATIEMMRI
jgi:tRNA U34 2-thiouridine synthase MnmA/TrmU